MTSDRHQFSGKAGGGLPQKTDEPHRTSAASRRLNWLLASVVAFVTICVFSGTFSFDFVHWDDDINIYGNPHLLEGISAKSVKWMFTDVDYIPRYMPLGWMSYAASYEISGLKPWSYHAGNILFHAVNGVLIFFLLQRLLRIGRGSNASPIGIMMAAFFGALLWAVHPLRSEVVACSSARIYGQALFFLLLSFFSYLRAREASHELRAWWLCASVAAFLISLLTYPLALGYCAVLVMIDFYPLRRISFSRESFFGAAGRKVLLEKLPFVAATLLVLGITMWARVNSGKWAAPVPLSEFGVFERLMQSFYVWGYYLWKPLWSTDLCPTYTTLVSFDAWSLPFLLSAALVVTISAIVLWKIRRWPAAAILWLCHLSLLVPFLGLSEHPHFTYDRYSHIVAIIWCVPLAWWLMKVWNSPRRRLGFNISGAAIIVLAVLAFQQAGRWKNTPTLLSYIVEKLGNHPMASKQEHILGIEYLVARDTTNAIKHLELALQITPDSADIHATLADTLVDQGKIDEAVAHYKTAIRAEPTHKTARQNLGVALGSAGRFEEALENFRALIRANTNDVKAHHNAAITLAQLGRKEEAMAEMAVAKQLSGAR